MAAHRIVSLIASATEIVTALGFEDQLVGRSHECDYPPSVERLPACSTSKVNIGASSWAIDDQVRSIVAEGLSVYRVDPDLLNQLAPTVIVTQTQCEVCAVSLKDVERAVCELVRSQPTIVSLEPMSLGDTWKDIRAVAAALDDQKRGECLVAELVGRLEAIRARTAALPTRPSVACIEWIDPLMTAGNWVPELVDIAGGTNLFGQAGRHSGYVETEQLTKADPDVIVIMPCGFDIDRARHEMPALASRHTWSQLAAVKTAASSSRTATSTSTARVRAWWNRPRSWRSSCIRTPSTSATAEPAGCRGVTRRFFRCPAREARTRLRADRAITPLPHVDSTASGLSHDLIGR